MSSILLVLLVSFVVALATVGVAVGLAVRTLVLRNRLTPAVETGAPLAWLWSPTAAARLHRRLRTALAPLGTATARPVPDAVAELVDHLTQQAVGIDRDLIEASRRHGPARRAGLRSRRAEVRRLEALAVELGQRRAAATGPAPGQPTRREALDEIRSRLDLLADAHAELLSLEEATLASDPDVLLRRITSAPPAPPGGPASAPPPERRATG